MRSGVHFNELGPALAPADFVWLFAGGGIEWDPHEALSPLEGRRSGCDPDRRHASADARHRTPRRQGAFHEQRRV